MVSIQHVRNHGNIFNTIMDDDKGSTNSKRLSMDDILRNLLSCSEQKIPLEKAVHVYDPRELQSAWQAVSCNAKYIACPDKRSPSVKSESSTSCSLTKQKRPTKEKRKDFRQENVSVKFNKYESLGVLSYGVPSWRTIVDPETCTYLQRSHPCHFNDASTKTGERSHGVTFLDPGGALDQHLGSFVRRQRANNTLQSSFGDNIGTSITFSQLRASCNVQLATKPTNLTQSNVQFPSENLRPPIRPKNVFHPGDITADLMPKPKANSIVPPIHIKRPKPGIYNSCVPLPIGELSPLLTSSKVVVGLGRSCPGKSPRDVAQSQHLKHFSPFNKSFAPVSFQIVRQTKKDQKLNWLPITSTTRCAPRHVSDGQSDDPKPEWSRTTGLSHNPINSAITHLKSQIPGRPHVALTSQLRPSVPCKVLELPLASTGLN